jgi:hypothetical protein
MGNVGDAPAATIAGLIAAACDAHLTTLTKVTQYATNYKGVKTLGSNKTAVVNLASNTGFARNINFRNVKSAKTQTEVGDVFGGHCDLPGLDGVACDVANAVIKTLPRTVGT